MNAQLDPTIMNARAAWTANLKRGQLPNAANALPKPDLKKDLKVAGPRLPEPQGDDDKGDSPKRKLPWLSLGPEKAATLKEATSLKASGSDGQGGVDDWASLPLIVPLVAAATPLATVNAAKRKFVDDAAALQLQQASCKFSLQQHGEDSAPAGHREQEAFYYDLEAHLEAQAVEKSPAWRHGVWVSQSLISSPP